MVQVQPIRVLMVVIAATLVGNAVANERQFVVVGYLPEYRMESVDDSRLSAITDLVYFGIVPTTNGAFPSDPVPNADLQKLEQMKQRLGCRLLVCVGGAGRSEGFKVLCSSDGSRNRFVRALYQYCLNHGFDGVDYDWEHPKDATEMADYVRLLRETKAVFARSKMLVTMAQAGWQDLGQSGYATVDRVHLMSYDHPFPQATLDKSTNEIDRLVKWGCPTEKITLGLAFLRPQS